MNKTILIGGGSGLMGTRLTSLLLEKGYHVRHLGRQAKTGSVPTFAWDAKKQAMDTTAFDGVNVVINLAGANVNGHRWTDKYKKELLDSRTQSTKLIVDFLNNQKHNVTQFIAGSAIGYYGFGDSSQLFRENHVPGTDFLAQLVHQWELESEKLKDRDRTKLAHVRTGIVLAKEGGALQEMARPIKMLAGSPLGSGEQIISWIHIDDICNIFIHLIENNLDGTFNGVAPEPVSNKQLTKAIAKELHKPLILPNVPGFALRIVLGEMSQAVVNGSRVSSEKIEATGFKFKFRKMEEAVKDVLTC